MVVDAAIVRAGDSAQFGASPGSGSGAGSIDLQNFDLLGAVVREAILQVDGRQRRRKLAQIGPRDVDEASMLAEAPMGGLD